MGGGAIRHSSHVRQLVYDSQMNLQVASAREHHGLQTAEVPGSRRNSSIMVVGLSITAALQVVERGALDGDNLACSQFRVFRRQARRTIYLEYSLLWNKFINL